MIKIVTSLFLVFMIISCSPQTPTATTLSHPKAPIQVNAELDFVGISIKDEIIIGKIKAEISRISQINGIKIINNDRNNNTNLFYSSTIKELPSEGYLILKISSIREYADGIKNDTNKMNHIAGFTKDVSLPTNIAIVVIKSIVQTLDIPSVNTPTEYITKIAINPPKHDNNPDSLSTYKQVSIIYKPLNLTYPETARSNSFQETVRVIITINENGIPTIAEALGYDKSLVAAAVEYALKFKFKPASIGNTPVKSLFALTVPFKLN